MFMKYSRGIVIAIAGLLLAMIPSRVMADEIPEARKAAAVAAAEEITSMRSNLARNFIKPDMEITEDTFKSVCGAVGKRVKEISGKEGFRIRHAAVKNRNPDFAANSDEVRILEEFDRNRGMKEKWDIIETEGRKDLRYMRPIFVEDACLACHGPKEKRPRFIVEKYPDDRAFDFKTGDLRGMVEVIIPAN